MNASASGSPRSALIAVLGVPRSGTSAVAGALQHLGVPMGLEFRPADERGAPRGFWEDAEFARLHADLLFPDVDEIPESLGGPRLDSYRDLVARRCAAGRTWGLKEAHLPFLFPHLVSVCPIPIRLIVTRRPFHQCVASWATWRDVPHRRAAEQLSAWLYAVDRAVEEFAGAQLEVQFADLLAHRAREVERIADFAGLAPSPAAVEFLEPTLKHF